MKAPQIEQIAPNFKTVIADGVQYWYSYDTCIAFQKYGKEMVVRSNDWGATTGKHLNAISSDKKSRVAGVVFEAYLAG